MAQLWDGTSKSQLGCAPAEAEFESGRVLQFPL
jgi:hypothetical protein